MNNKKLTALSVFAALSVAASTLVACGDDLPAVDCTTPAVPKYSELAIINACTTCHDSQKSGAARLEAPTDINYDTYEAAKAGAEEGVSEVFGGTMPPGGGELSEELKTQFYRWGLCGTPN